MNSFLNLFEERNYSRLPIKEQYDIFCIRGCDINELITARGVYEQSRLKNYPNYYLFGQNRLRRETLNMKKKQAFHLAQKVSPKFN